MRTLLKNQKLSFLTTFYCLLLSKQIKIKVQTCQKCPTYSNLSITSNTEHIVCTPPPPPPRGVGGGWAAVHPPPPPFCWGGGGVEPPTKFSKMRGLVGPPFLEWCCWERGSDFFQGGYNFSTIK